jgi:hypothetical protein
LIDISGKSAIRKDRGVIIKTPTYMASFRYSPLDDRHCTIFAEGGFYVEPAEGGMRHEKGISFLPVVSSLAEFGWVQRLGL